MRDIRIAQIGCGHWGRNLARNFAEIGALAALVDGNPAVAAAMSAQHGVAALTLDQALADPSIAGLSIATPAETHAEMAARALKAGKHVFVEKPMALTSADCRKMIQDAQSAGRHLMVGHLLQYHPAFLALLDLSRSGDLGTLRYVYSNRLSLGKFRTEEDVLWSFAPHDLSMILALAAEKVTSVSAQGASFVTPGIVDMALCQIGFGSGLQAHVFTSWCHPFKEQRLVVVGSTGMAVFEDSQPDWDRKLAIYRHVVNTSGPVPVPMAAPAEHVAVPRSEPLKEECREFVAAIAEDRSPRTGGSEGLAVIEVLERASAAMGGAV